MEMTATRSPQVEKVARAICEADKTAPAPDASILIGMKPAKAWEGRVEMAQAALDACHAEELATALRDLLEDTQHRDHNCGDTPENCPVLKARALLAKLDGQP